MRDQLEAAFRGWRSLGIRKSDGETMCTGCWDRSNHDTEAEHDIPKGGDVWWSSPHPEYGDCDAYCTKCVIEDADAWEIIKPNEASEMLSALLASKENDNG